MEKDNDYQKIQNLFDEIKSKIKPISKYDDFSVEFDFIDIELDEYNKKYNDNKRIVDDYEEWFIEQVNKKQNITICRNEDSCNFKNDYKWLSVKIGKKLNLQIFEKDNFEAWKHDNKYHDILFPYVNSYVKKGYPPLMSIIERPSDKPVYTFNLETMKPTKNSFIQRNLSYDICNELKQLYKSLRDEHYWN